MKRCGCCGLDSCVCDDRDFNDAVRERDLDTIIMLIAQRNEARACLAEAMQLPNGFYPNAATWNRWRAALSDEQRKHCEEAIEL